MKDFSVTAEDAAINNTCQALEANGINAVVVDNGAKAKQAVLDMVTEGAEILTMTSVTLDTIGLSTAINESDRYVSARNKLNSMDRTTDGREMARLGAAPEWSLGSVHAVTEDGHIIIASNTGSQLAAHVYGSDHVVFVVGAQKIVKDNDEAYERVYQHSLPLEEKRAMQAYGIKSFVSKLLTINREVEKDRITVIIVKEQLGF